jgi:hypothetical protein
MPARELFKSLRGIGWTAVGKNQDPRVGCLDTPGPAPGDPGAMQETKILAVVADENPGILGCGQELAEIASASCPRSLVVLALWPSARSSSATRIATS